MKKFKNLIFLFILSICIFGLISFFIIKYEYQKKLENQNKESLYYKSLYENWDLYKTDITSQIENAKIQNQNSMNDAKKIYDDLLADQANLIQNHTKAGEQVVITTGSTSTSTNKVSISRPKTVTKTKSS